MPFDRTDSPVTKIHPNTDVSLQINTLATYFQYNNIFQKALVEAMNANIPMTVQNLWDHNYLNNPTTKCIGPSKF